MQRYHINNHSRASRFSTAGGCDEIHCMVRSDQGMSFDAALDSIVKRYAEMCEQLKLSHNDAVLARVYLSDIENQKNTSRTSALPALFPHSVISVVQGRPLMCGPIMLSAYHLLIPSAPSWQRTEYNESLMRMSTIVPGRHYRMLLTANFGGRGAVDSYEQTNGVLSSLGPVLESSGMTLCDNTIRTWIYVRDIDTRYSGMVKSRREFFASNGLTEKTRYLASTGIEGKSLNLESAISFDSLSYAPLAPAQIVRMEVPSHMPPTISYGVTFERGLRVRFGDRSHLYISGTASIDAAGAIMHPGNCTKQAGRMVENVDALLRKQGAGLGDMACAILYVRDIHDAPTTCDIVSRALPPDTPLVVVEGSVCRPGWLTEMEGIALVKDTNDFPAFL